MARQRTNEGLRLRRTITKPEPEKPMIWRIVPGILMPLGGTAATVLSPLIFKHRKFYEETRNGTFQKTREQPQLFPLFD